MIQRAQSIYLGLAFICMVLMLVFPLYTVTATMEGLSQQVSFGAYGMEGDLVAEADMPLYLLYISLALVSFAGLVSFKKRPRQLLIARLGLILHFLAALGMVMFYYLGQTLVLKILENADLNESEVSVSMGMGIYLIIITVPLYILAVRGIKRDEKLVKSLDRLR